MRAAWSPMTPAASCSPALKDSCKKEQSGDVRYRAHPLPFLSLACLERGELRAEAFALPGEAVSPSGGFLPQTPCIRELRQHSSIDRLWPHARRSKTRLYGRIAKGFA